MAKFDDVFERAKKGAETLQKGYNTRPTHYDEAGHLEAFGKGVLSASAGLAADVLDIADYAGSKLGISDYQAEPSSIYKSLKDTQEENALHLQPYSTEWAAGAVGNMVPSAIQLGLEAKLLPVSGPARLVGRGAGAIAGKLGLGPAARQAASTAGRYLATDAAVTSLEGGHEAINAYNDALENGMTSEQADKVFKDVLFDNVQALMASNLAQVGAVRGLGKAGRLKAAGNVAALTGTSAWEEGRQLEITNEALGIPTSTADIREVQAAGAIGAGALGAGGAVGARAFNRARGQQEPQQAGNIRENVSELGLEDGVTETPSWDYNRANLVMQEGIDWEGLRPEAQWGGAAVFDVAKGLGVPIVQISSGNRTPERNASANGASNSWHTHANAVDMVLLDESGNTLSENDPRVQETLKRARELGWKEAGYHDYGSGYHVHLGGFNGEQRPSLRKNEAQRTFNPELEQLLQEETQQQQQEDASLQEANNREIVEQQQAEQSNQLQEQLQVQEQEQLQQQVADKQLQDFVANEQMQVQTSKQIPQATLQQASVEQLRIAKENVRSEKIKRQIDSELERRSNLEIESPELIKSERYTPEAEGLPQQARAIEAQADQRMIQQAQQAEMQAAAPQQVAQAQAQQQGQANPRAMLENRLGQENTGMINAAEDLGRLAPETAQVARDLYGRGGANTQLQYIGDAKKASKAVLQALGLKRNDVKGTKGKLQGAAQYYPEIQKTVVGLFEGNTPQTAAHEYAHGYFNRLNAQEKQAYQNYANETKDQWKQLTGKDYKQYPDNKYAHERFADEFAAYYFEQVELEKPSLIDKIFQKMRDIFDSIMNEVSALNQLRSTEAYKQANAEGLYEGALKEARAPEAREQTVEKQSPDKQLGEKVKEESFISKESEKDKRTTREQKINNKINNQKDVYSYTFHKGVQEIKANKNTMEVLEKKGWKKTEKKNGDIVYERPNANPQHIREVHITGAMQGTPKTRSLPWGIKSSKIFNNVMRAAFNDLHDIIAGTQGTVAERRGIIVEREAQLALNGAASRAQGYLEFGGTFKDVDGKTRNVRGLADVMKDVGENNIGDFNEYLIAKRVEELSDYGHEYKLLKPEAQEIIKSIEEKNPEWRKYQQEVVDFNNLVLEQLKDADIISQESYDYYLEKHKNYVPFSTKSDKLDVSSIADGIGSRKIANLSDPIKKIKGSKGEIKAPLSQTIARTYALIDLAGRNKAAKNILDLVDEHKGKDTGLNLIFEEVKEPSRDTIAVWDKGKKRHVLTTPAMKYALASTNTDSMGLISKIMQMPARALRTLATISPEFALSNATRDTMTAWFYSKNGFIPLYDTVRGVAHAFGKTKLYQEWLKEGGAYGGRIDEAGGKKMPLERNFATNVAVGITGKVLFPAKAAHKFAESLNKWIEDGTRVAEYDLVARGYKGVVDRLTSTGVQRSTDPQILREASYASREITIDFKRGGYISKQINKYIPFFNVGAQAVDKLAREAVNHPKNFVLKGAALAMVSLAVAAFNGDDDDIIQEEPQYAKDLYWLLKIGDNTIFRLPKPQGMGNIICGLTERFMDWVKHNRKPDWQDMLKMSWESVMPGFVPTYVNLAIGFYGNYDPFTERNIENVYEKEKPSWQRFDSRTSTVAKEAGKLALFRELDLSPKKIDFLIRQTTATLGSDITRLPDYFQEGRTALYYNEMPLFGFNLSKPFIRTGRLAPQSVQDVQNRIKEIEKTQEEIKDGFKEDGIVSKAELNILKNYQKQITRQRKRIKEIEEDERLSAKEKRERIDELRNRISELGVRAMDTTEKFRM